MGRQFKPGQLQSGSLYNITASSALTASYVNTLTQQVVVSGSVGANIFMQPQSLTSDVSIPANYYATLIGPVASNYSIEVGLGSYLIIKNWYDL